MRMPKKGDEVRVKLDDHTQNDPDGIARVVLYGRVFKVTKDALILDSWADEDPDGHRALRDTTETFAIMRRAIREIAVCDKWRVL